MKKPELTIVDYIIIIVIIIAIAFAFIHISTDKGYEVQSTSFDSSTMTKVIPTYLDKYRDGLVVNSAVTGHNATTGENIEIKGKLVWIGEDYSSKPVAQIEANGEKYLVGSYAESPYCDIYIDKITIETDGHKNNVTEFKIKPKNITSLNDLKLNINKTYEVTTRLGLSDMDNTQYQELFNELIKIKRISIRMSDSSSEHKLYINRASNDELTLGSDILGNINGLSGDISIRIYNCTDSDIKLINETFDVNSINTY